MVSFSNPAIAPPAVNPSLVFLSCVLLRLEGVNANLEDPHYDQDLCDMILTMVINNITITNIILILTSS